MIKDKNGVEFMIGDTIMLDSCSEPDTIVSIDGDRAKVRFPSGSTARYLLNRGDLTIIKRADGSPPRAGDGAEDGLDRPVLYSSGTAARIGDRIFHKVIRTHGEVLALLSSLDGHNNIRARWSDGRELPTTSANCELVRCAGAPIEPAPPPVAATEPPLTFPLCPRCHERMTGAECGQPACVQARKWAAMRKAEEGMAAKYEAFQELVRIGLEGKRVAVVTDRINRDGYDFMAELSANGIRRVLSFRRTDGAYTITSSVAGTVRLMEAELGKRAMGGGR